MSQYTIEELGEIIAKHKKWIMNEDGSSRANLSGANLYGADLSRANLSRANLSGANLSRADLYGANLSRADLSRADLYGANLSRANLSGANLSRADLYGANLYGANLYGANLSGANLSGANLSRADLYGANLSQIGGRDVNTFLSVTGIGREGRQTLWWVEEDIVWCGCFKGSMSEFEDKVKSQHGDSIHGQNYRDAILFMKSVANRNGLEKGE